MPSDKKAIAFQKAKKPIALFESKKSKTKQKNLVVS
jgi:hypothetical protein